LVFVVAEIGVNWDGSIELAEEMMRTAKNVGCDAVKFQAYQESMVKAHPQWQRLMKTTIKQDNIQAIDRLSKEIGIEWFCTPMYPEAVELLGPFVKRFKIREFDSKPLLENKTSELLERVLRTGKEVIISSNKSPKRSGNQKVKWLYVVPKYPCGIEDLNFNNLREFDGYSNHHPHIIAPLTASILGAQIIEVHITADKTKDYIDNNVSFDYGELKQLIDMIRLAEQIKK